MALDQDNMDAALDEIETVQRMSGLDHQTILDICFDYDVDPRAIYESLELDWPE